MRAIRDYFQNNYSYSLEPLRLPMAADPLNHFLLNPCAAHCEFFASGAVMLLRLQGIPARYATGYRVIDREGDEGDHWIARNRDAHAWAEAYDDQQQQWVLVEATPGFIDASQEDPLGNESELGGGQVGGLSLVSDSANALVGWWRAMPSSAKANLFAMLAVAAAGPLLLMLRRTRWSDVAGRREGADPTRMYGQRLLRRMDRRLKRHGLARGHSETMHQFARRLRTVAEGRQAWLRPSADWYVAYAHARFGGASVEPPPLPATNGHTAR
jgi:hypothetical protein